MVARAGVESGWCGWSSFNSVGSGPICYLDRAAVSPWGSLLDRQDLLPLPKTVTDNADFLLGAVPFAARSATKLPLQLLQPSSVGSELRLDVVEVGAGETHGFPSVAASKPSAQSYPGSTLAEG